MTRKEYEYNFKVNSLDSVIKYLNDNGYIKTCILKQTRKVYENKNNPSMIARITTNIVDDKEEVLIDFKNVKNKENNLKISDESVPIQINDNEIDKYLSILDVLEFEFKIELIRTRYIYEKNNVKFEIDDYIYPKMCVVALEGNCTEVDAEYKRIINTIGCIVKEEKI